MEYLRILRLIKECISNLKLNLDGYTVYTEVGTGPFICTPVIAALAGAEKVYALANNTIHGTIADSFSQLDLLLEATGLNLNIEKVTEKKREHFKQTDILTNLGPIRPIDFKTISMLDETRAVVPYMCEAWEIRPGDVDIQCCFDNNIPVMGTNEDHPLVDCINSSGLIVVKLLLEYGLEIRKNRIIIYSKDKFGGIIKKYLTLLEAEVILVEDELHLYENALVENADALIIADYNNHQKLISDQGLININRIKQINPSMVLIPFAGYVNLEYVKKINLKMYPMENLESYRMIRTLAYLGYQPTLSLLAAGLKVGQIMRELKANQEFGNVFELMENAKSYSGFRDLAQIINS